MDMKVIKGVWEAFLEVQEKKLSPKQKQLDVDKDGDIEADDLAALRAKKEGYGKMKKESSCGGKMRKEEKEECPKCKGEGCDHCDGKGYHETEKEGYGSKKMKESNLFSDKELSSIEEKISQTQGATKPEELMDKESAKSKEFADKHNFGGDDKHPTSDYDERGHDDATKAGRATKASAARKGDNLSNGDAKNPTKPKDTTK